MLHQNYFKTLQNKGKMEKSKKNTISIIECGVQHPFAGRNIQQLPMQSVNIVKYENNY